MLTVTQPARHILTGKHIRGKSGNGWRKSADTIRTWHLSGSSLTSSGGPGDGSGEEGAATVNFHRMRELIAYERRLRFDRLKKLSKATKITTTITGMPHGSSTANKIEDGAIALAEVEDVYREVIAELKEMRSELEELLHELDNPDDIGIMRLRYMHGWRLQDIPDAVCISERGMYYHLAGAERKLAKMFPDRVKLR